MNETLAKATASTKNFVSKHKVALTAAASITACVVVQTRITNHWNEFLTEHGLLETYYHMNEED